MYECKVALCVTFKLEMRLRNVIYCYDYYFVVLTYKEGFKTQKSFFQLMLFLIFVGSFSVFYYNFPWQDYGVAPMSTLLDIVKVMQFAMSKGKVAVHCHAGLGKKTSNMSIFIYFPVSIDPNMPFRDMENVL